MKSMFLQDVLEQPKALRELLKQKGTLVRMAKTLRHDSVLFLGMGASYYASLYATIYLRSHGIDAQCRELSEFIWYDSEKLLERYETIFLVSQSGETAELTRFLDLYAGKINNCVLVTNNPQSSNAKVFTDSRVFPVFAGIERAMGSSKTFLNTIVTLLIVASAWIGEELNYERLIEYVENALTLKIELFTQDLLKKENSILVARGFAIPIMRMAQLTLAEISKVNSVVYSGAGFRHGPMELMVTNPLVVVTALHGKTFGLTLDLLGDLSSYENVWCITDYDRPIERSIVIKEGLEEPLSSIPVMVILQKAADDLAVAKGYEPGVGMIASKVTRKE
ncbi:SIS domain-containing protein [Pseudothermotoga sp. U03pept]|uniref:SIS domain-containing protein n=1 Tax=Pseudothermotoga sp. U03pept TaxID=3447012 RepID=UPI003F128568